VSESKADFIQDGPVIQPPPPAGARVVFDPGWCRTCRVCEVMCSIAKEGTARPALARINVFFDEFREENPISASLCFQCADAACMEACPKEALSRDGRTGAVVVDEGRCNGCMLCEKACPWDVPRRHPERRVSLKCDLCVERADGPLCVQMCPLSGKALRYEAAMAEEVPQ
jgi:carbon-monoxide dehydrogenase iron sulfur subunit